MGGVCHRPSYYIGDIMIVRKKENHYCQSHWREEAQKLVNDGYEVVKNSFGGDKIVKQEAKKAEPKKKATPKKKSAPKKKTTTKKDKE